MVNFKTKRTYSSGKISGLNYFDTEVKFEQADDEIRSLGFKPVNPLKSWLPRRSPWCLHIAADLILMLTCSRIYLHTDWERSRGAKIEKRFADLLGYEKIYQEVVVNTRKVNEASDKKEAFFAACLRNVKIRFQSGDKRVARFMEIARSFGVEWTDYSPREDSAYFPANGFLYVWEAKDGSFHFAHGGGREFFNKSPEKEITPDQFFDIWDQVERMTNDEEEDPSNE